MNATELPFELENGVMRAAEGGRPNSTSQKRQAELKEIEDELKTS
jgi:hypothetical protein